MVSPSKPSSTARQRGASQSENLCRCVFKQPEKVFPGSGSLGRLVVGEPLQVVSQHSFGFKRLAAAAGMRPLAGVVQLVDPQQRAGEEELSTGDAVVALLSCVLGSLVASQRA